MKRRELRRMARRLLQLADEGHELIAVPRYLASEVHVLLYTRGVERASEKWAQKSAEVPLADWKTAMEDQRARWPRHPGEDSHGL